MPERKLRALGTNIEALFALFLILIKIAQQPTLILIFRKFSDLNSAISPLML